MKKILFFVINIIIIGTSSSAVSETIAEDQEKPEPQQVTMADLISHAYNENPSIQAAREGWRAVVEKYRAAVSYPDPQFMITYFPEPIETRLGPQDWNANLSQMIPFPGKLSKAGEGVQIEARMAKLNLDKTVRDVIVSIKKSYHELLYIQQAKKIAMQNAALIEELRKIGENAYAQDRTAFLDVVKSQSQTAQMRYDIILLEELEQTEKTRLNGLLNRSPDSHLGTLEPVPFKPLLYKLKELYPMAEAAQEEILMADMEVKKKRIQEELASYQNRPDFKVGIFYAGIGNPDVPSPPADAGDDAVGIQFGVNIPLWSGKNNSIKAAARAMTEKSKSAKTALVNKTRTKIHTLYFKLQNSKRLITLYKDDMLPQALNALETSETWFREGQGSFSDFVEAQAAAYNFQLSLARAMADYGKNLASLEQLVGQSLTQRQKKFDSEEEK